MDLMLLMMLLLFVLHLQAHAIKMALEAKGLSTKVYVGMRYWYPFTEEAVQQVSPYSFGWLAVYHVTLPVSFLYSLPVCQDDVFFVHVFLFLIE